MYDKYPTDKAMVVQSITYYWILFYSYHSTN